MIFLSILTSNKIRPKVLFYNNLNSLPRDRPTKLVEVLESGHCQWTVAGFRKLFQVSEAVLPNYYYLILPYKMLTSLYNCSTYEGHLYESTLLFYVWSNMFSLTNHS